MRTTNECPNCKGASDGCMNCRRPVTFAAWSSGGKMFHSETQYHQLKEMVRPPKRRM